MVRPMTTKTTKKGFLKLKTGQISFVIKEMNVNSTTLYFVYLTANLLLELNVVFAIIHISVLIVNAEH